MHPRVQLRTVVDPCHLLPIGDRQRELALADSRVHQLRKQTLDRLRVPHPYGALVGHDQFALVDGLGMRGPLDVVASGHTHPIADRPATHRPQGDRHTRRATRVVPGAAPVLDETGLGHRPEDALTRLQHQVRAFVALTGFGRLEHGRQLVVLGLPGTELGLVLLFGLLLLVLLEHDALPRPGGLTGRPCPVRAAAPRGHPSNVRMRPPAQPTAARTLPATRLGRPSVRPAKRKLRERVDVPLARGCDGHPPFRTASASTRPAARTPPPGPPTTAATARDSTRPSARATPAPPGRRSMPAPC